MDRSTHQKLSQILGSAFMVFCLLVSFKASAAEIAGVTFNKSYYDQGINMALQGTGLKTMLFFKAFVAGFYKGKGNDSDLLGNYPKRIEVEYFVNIPGQKLNNFTLETMKDNITKTDLEFLVEEIKMPLRKPADFYLLVKKPESKTSVRQ